MDQLLGLQSAVRASNDSAWNLLLGVIASERVVPTLGRRKWSQIGFTLIELLIVVAIVAILSAIAYPSYNSYIVKTHRAAATACLSEYANYMERYYTTNLRYDHDTSATPVANPDINLDCMNQTAQFYGYDFGTPTANKYTVTATPKSTEAKCGTLTLDQSGTRTKSGTDSLARCW